MKKIYLKTLFLFLFSLIGINAFAYNCEVDGIYYDLNKEDNTASVISKPDGGYYRGMVDIPSSITYEENIYSVTTICDKAFYKCRGLISVTIPNSIISIGNSAFRNCI